MCALLGFRALNCIDEALASLLKHVVRERNVHIAEGSLGKVSKELLNRFGLLACVIAFDDCQELVKLYTTRTVVIYQFYEMFDLIDSVNKPETDERFFHLIESNLARAVVIETLKALLQRLELAA